MSPHDAAGSAGAGLSRPNSPKATTDATGALNGAQGRECTRRIWGEPDGLRCVETGPHETHTYRASAGADLETVHHATGDEQ